MLTMQQRGKRHKWKYTIEIKYLLLHKLLRMPARGRQDRQWHQWEAVISYPRPNNWIWVLSQVRRLPRVQLHRPAEAPHHWICFHRLKLWRNKDPFQLLCNHSISSMLSRDWSSKGFIKRQPSKSWERVSSDSSLLMGETVRWSFLFQVTAGTDVVTDHRTTSGKPRGR